MSLIALWWQLAHVLFYPCFDLDNPSTLILKRNSFCNWPSLRLFPWPSITSFLTIHLVWQTKGLINVPIKQFVIDNPQVWPWLALYHLSPEIHVSLQPIQLPITNHLCGQQSENFFYELTTRAWLSFFSPITIVFVDIWLVKHSNDTRNTIMTSFSINLWK